MEGRRMATRSGRRTPPSVSPIEQAVMANVMGAGKGSVRRSSRKVLADKTNASTPVAGLVPTSKTAKKGGTVVDQIIKEAASTPARKMRSIEQLPRTPVLRGEDLLRSVVCSNLSMIQTPTGLSSHSPQAETPQFGAPRSPQQQEEAAATSEEEVTDARHVEASPKSDLVPVSQRLSSAWVGCDVNEVPEVGDDDDSDCSILVNVSSPSPAPATIHPTTPETIDFKAWQRRESQKVKESGEEECAFNYYEDEDYEGCDEYDGEDFGQVIGCDEICQGISRITVSDGLPEHKGRHIRFNYNSDDEVDVEEVDVMRLRGLPTPTGKHLRFPEDKELSSP